MTTLLEGARRLVTRGTAVGARVEGLERAAIAARGVLPDALVDEAEGVVDRAASRLRLSADHTVVAIAGATGSGKSSTFNALAGMELSSVGVRRPTTSWATACTWSSEGASEGGSEAAPELLDWLGIPERHRVARDSLLDPLSDSSRTDRQLAGVVLLDLPDHDSTEVAHHLEVDRLVRLADLMVWVLDPQKYADGAIHERYLRPLAGHAEVMLVVLNHIDTVPPERRDAMVADVRRLLAADGLPDVPVVAVSAREGLGIPALKAEIAKRVATKKAARQRLEADLKGVATRMQDESGAARPARLSRERVSELEGSFADAAGVPTVVAAVEKSTRRRARRATGWPVTAWVSSLRPDPLRRLHLDLRPGTDELASTARTSVPQPTRVQRARVDAAVRSAADEIGAGLGRPWQQAIRRASVSRLDDLTDALDGALARTDLGVARVPWWARAVRVVQWLLMLAAIVGGVWLLALLATRYLDLAVPDPPTVAGFALPLVLLVGGVAAGVLLALLCRLLVSWTARARARAANRRLRQAVGQVTGEIVVTPVESVLASYESVREGLAAALK